MDSLHLNVKQTFRINQDFALLADPFGQFDLIHFFNRSPFVFELCIFSKLFQLSEFSHVKDPFIGFQVFCIKLSEMRIGAQNPSSDGYSISFVYEFVRENLAEILKQVAFQEL